MGGYAAYGEGDVLATDGRGSRRRLQCEASARTARRIESNGRPPSAEGLDTGTTEWAPACRSAWTGKEGCLSAWEQVVLKRTWSAITPARRLAVVPLVSANERCASTADLNTSLG